MKKVHIAIFHVGSFVWALDMISSEARGLTPQNARGERWGRRQCCAYPFSFDAPCDKHQYLSALLHYHDWSTELFVDTMAWFVNPHSPRDWIVEARQWDT